MDSDREGYKKLIVWQNVKKLRRRVYEITGRFSKAEYRRVSQMRDAARSAKQNIQEGYGQTLATYLHALDVAQSSLHELQGDIEDSREDQLISEAEYRELDELCGKTDYLFKRLIQSLRNLQKRIEAAKRGKPVKPC